ncbi:hypothetical protein E3E35_06380 [Thermococcus sp. GR7]|uniref:NYN domain-containing protein n=1 Tax=unclassified Thermococcus TaxID=2627626 RepID=UPI001430EC29|nr:MULTISPECIES: hypothetical protein [unclassified Thermococcus]NJE47036.1 hypothetical protein [Thermococcus sp. GR7]NJE78139.1 hypothetical protein [Thermococcus sp. GR4]NJF22744.1 hypothetical protein [Thermococcus sp. GR5]
MPGNPELVYVDDIEGGPVIVVRKYEDYKSLLNKYKPDVMYASNRYFYFWDGNKFYALRRRGYKTFRDLELSVKLGFWDASENLKSIESIGEKVDIDYVKIIIRGYNKEGKQVTLKFNSEGELFYYAMDSGFEDFNEFVDALKLGFLDGESFRKALSGGFAGASEYFDAIEGGFTRFDEYDEARRLNIPSKWEYDLFKELSLINEKYSLKTIEEAHLIKIICDMPVGERASLLSLWNRLHSERTKVLRRYNIWNRNTNWYGEPEILISPKSLEEYLVSSKIIRKFGKYDEKAKLFVRILPGGFLSEDEYKDATSRGYRNRREYLDAQKRGFIGSLNKLRSIEPFTIFETTYKVSGTPNLNLGEECKIKSGRIGEWKKLTLKDLGISTEAELYRYAVDNGFESFGEFFESLKLGTLKREEYLAAKKGKFKSILELWISKGLGHSKRQELIQEIYADYEELKKLKETYKLRTYGDALVFRLLRTLQQKKRKIDLDSLWRWLKECEYTYFSRESLWYHLGRKSRNYRTFTSKEELEKYLITLLKRHDELGTYDPESKLFVPKLPPVIVDGSNVAWEGRDKRGGERALAKNIELVVEKLKELGYSEIYVFVDASLKYQVEDRGLLEKLIVSKIVKLMPAEVQADEYIIKYALDIDAYIISNDRYKEWRKKNPDLEEFIKTHRVTFTIHKGIVHFDEKIEGL